MEKLQEQVKELTEQVAAGDTEVGSQAYQMELLGIELEKVKQSTSSTPKSPNNKTPSMNLKILNVQY